MSINVRRLSFALGGEVTGVDLRETLDKAQWSQIHAAFLEHQMLVFPGQTLSPENLISFCGRFGPLFDFTEDPTYRLEGYSKIYELGNYMRDGKMSRTKDAGRKWHSDHSYTTEPHKISILYARAVPPVGGTTCFANMYMAYDELSEKMKGFLDDMEAIHDVLKYFGTQIVGFKPTLKNSEGIKKKHPPVLQPVVRVHEETGRKALFLSEGSCTSLYGLEPEEGDGLLQYLLKHSVREQYTYRHTYKVNDLIMWDNRCLQHLAPPDYVHNAENLRHMYRLTVLGSPCGRLLDTQAEEFKPH